MIYFSMFYIINWVNCHLWSPMFQLWFWICLTTTKCFLFYIVLMKCGDNNYVLGTFRIMFTCNIHFQITWDIIYAKNNQCFIIAFMQLEKFSMILNTTTKQHLSPVTVQFWLILRLMLSGDLWATTLKLFFLSPFSPLFDADK